MAGKPKRSSARNRRRPLPSRNPTEVFQCELPDGPLPVRAPGLGKTDRLSGTGKSRLLKFREDFTWTDVSLKAYKPQKGRWRGVKRQELIGSPEDSTDFHLRYFEIEPGGYSSLETHRHAHAVTSIRGEGKVVVGDKAYPLGFLDTIYIAPNTPHQLLNEGREPFGFFCTVDAVRDRPQPVAIDKAKGERQRARGKRKEVRTKPDLTPRVLSEGAQ